MWGLDRNQHATPPPRGLSAWGDHQTGRATIGSASDGDKPRPRWRAGLARMLVAIIVRRGQAPPKRRGHHAARPRGGDEPCFPGNPGRRFALPWAVMLMPHSGRWTRVAEIFGRVQTAARLSCEQCVSSILPKELLPCWWCRHLPWSVHFRSSS